MDPEPQDPNSKNSLDLNNILLPKKGAPSLDSAQRIDAGTLLQQEQTASLIKPAQNLSSGSGEPGQGSPPVGGSSPSSSSVSQVQKPSPSIDDIAPLQTFQGDIASVIQNKGVSLVSIAAAEATRRGQQPVSQDAAMGNTPAPHTLRNIFFWIIGLLLVAGAVGALGYILLFKAPLTQQQPGVAPFIIIDDTNKVSVQANTQGPALIKLLTAAKNSVSLSLGLVAQLYVEQAATSTEGSASYMSAQTLFALLASDMPQALVRDISPVYLLGVHSFGVNQPFLILKVDSYEQGYAGMLAWEQFMKKDLSPLFAYTPAPKITKPAQNLSSGSTSASSTAATSSPELPVAQTGFIDAIVNNHDARVTKDQYGTINFLWTFIDRQTLVITTNPDTLREITTRLTQAPILFKSTAQ